MNKTVTDYINKQPSPQKQICNKLRKLILKTYPEIVEEFKLGVPYYSGHFYIVGPKDHVNLGFSLKHLPKSEHAKLSGGGKTFKCLEFKSVKAISEKEVIGLLKKTKIN